MKESKYSVDNRIVFRETFESEDSVRRNGGTPTDVVFTEGVGRFNGSSSKILYKLSLNGIYSIRIKFKSITAAQGFFADFRYNSGTGHFYATSASIVGTNNGTMYVDNTQTTTYNSNSKHFVVCGISIKSERMYVGSTYLSATFLNATIELFEIYKGTLTASEVANLYNNSFNIPYLNKNALMLFDATQGGLIDRSGLRTLTATDVVTRREGNSYSAVFNGSTSKIDTGSDWIGTKAVTVCGWIKLNNYGEASGIEGDIFTNAKSIFSSVRAGSQFQLTSNAWSNVAVPAVNSIVLFKWIFISTTRKLDGKGSFYLGSKSISPALSSTSDQNSGIPAAGTTNVIIGNNTGQTRTMNGSIKMLNIYEGILSLQEITQIWQNTRKLI